MSLDRKFPDVDSEGQGKAPTPRLMAVGISTGLGLGLALGLALQSIPVGLALGLAIGVAFGTSLERRDQQMPVPPLSQSWAVLGVVLIILALVGLTIAALLLR